MSDVKAVLLPVKRFKDSKRRLAQGFAPAQRELLARTMFEDTWETLLGWRGVDELMVVTAEPFVLAAVSARQASQSPMRNVGVE
jgi:2-phospho-L-lactate guanylyltransferase (CobY/MobA/RfbA family)